MLSERVLFAREVGCGLLEAELPAYAPMLAAFHSAHAADLRAVVADLPLRPSDRVLDLACGDGVYAVWLAERLSPQGEVVAVDLSPAYLELARRTAAASPVGGRISLQLADAYDLPFDDDSFDLAWCAQSMFSLPDPLGALRELRRVTRPGGVVAVLENDLLHQMMLPWPPDVELAVRQAQLASLEAANPDQLAVGRDLRMLFSEAGLADCRLTPYSRARHAPLAPDDEFYLCCQLSDVRLRARPYLSPTMLTAFDALTDASSEAFMLRQPEFVVTYMDLLALGVKG